MKKRCRYLMALVLFTLFGGVATMYQMNSPALMVEASELDYKLLYTVEQDGTASITGYEGMVETLVIPSEIDGYPVSKIDVQAFATSGEELYNDENSYCSVEKLIIEDGVTEIELEAFLNCKNLKAVTLPNTLDYVWDMAFCGCDSLKEIKIPSGTGRICEAAFGYTYECNYIEGVYDYEAWTEKMSNFTIYGEADSVAESYANENAFTFIALDDIPVTTPSSEITTTTTGTTTTSTSTTTKAIDDSGSETTTTFDEESTATTIKSEITSTTTTVGTSSSLSDTTSETNSATTTITTAVVTTDEAETTDSIENITATTETTTTATTHIASDDELCDWAMKDYEEKTGVTPASAEIEYTADDTAIITMIDAEGNILDVYTIDPNTGTGTESDGGEVNLPQTGYSNWYHTTAALAACVTVIGGVMVIGSGVLKKKR